VALEVFQRAGARLGEGPCWHGGTLIWIDILAHEVHVGERIYRTPGYPGAAVPRTGGGLLLAMDGFAALDLETGEVTAVAPIELGDRVRMNDGKCDPAGRFWAGSMAVDETPGRGALYRLDGPGGAERVLAPVTVSNGLGWSPDGATMYYIDTPTRTIRRFPFDASTGALGEPAVLDTSAWSGLPDGMTVDADGDLWVAFWDGWAVRRLSPEGELLEEVEMPVQRPTSCTFGGPDLDRLLITTASVGVRDQPLAGSIFVLEPGVAGLPATPAAA
jgi:sugar lactone lactonase YvrE